MLLADEGADRAAFPLLLLRAACARIAASSKPQARTRNPDITMSKFDSGSKSSSSAVSYWHARTARL